MAIIFGIGFIIFLAWLVMKLMSSSIVDDMDVYLGRAQTAFNTGNFDLTIRILTEAISKYPDNYIFYNNRGNAKYQLDQFEEALADFTKSYNLLSDFDRNKMAFINIKKAEAAISYKNFFSENPNSTMEDFVESNQQEILRKDREEQEAKEEAAYHKRKRAEAQKKAAEAKAALEAKGLYFKNMYGSGRLTCTTCGHGQSVTVFIHGADENEDENDEFPNMYAWTSSAYQCQKCGKFSTITKHHTDNKPASLICSCGGELTREKLVFCSECKGKEVVYEVHIIT